MLSLSPARLLYKMLCHVTPAISVDIMNQVHEKIRLAVGMVSLSSPTRLAHPQVMFRSP